MNLDEKLAAIHVLWTPKIAGQTYGMHVQAVTLEGEFAWHSHEDADGFFVVRSGRTTNQMRGRPEVALGPDEFFVVPRSVERRPPTDAECSVLLLEPAGVVNTGDASVGAQTVSSDD